MVAFINAHEIAPSKQTLKYQTKPSIIRVGVVTFKKLITR